MNIQQSPLYQEVLKVFSDGAKDVHYKWEAAIRANSVIVSTYQVRYVQISRSYHSQQYSDEMVIEVTMRPGDYDFLVWPYKDSLEMILTRTPLVEGGADQNPNNPILHLRYRAVPLDQHSDVVTNNNAIGSSKNIQDDLTIKTARFQLIDLVIERLRMVSGGCVVRNTDAGNTVRCLLGLYSDMANIDNDIAVKGVDLVPGYNNIPRDHIAIPHGIAVTDIPFYVHKYCGGVYSTGLAAYLQNSIWYVFPPYNLQRYHTTTNNTVLTVVNIPANRMPLVERSYRVTPTQVIILANGENKHKDFSEPVFQNAGNGMRYGDASTMLDSFATVSDNKATAKRANNAIETIFETRTTGLNHVTMSDARFTSNMAFEKSKLAYRAGMFLVVGWEQADHTVIYPGMPVRYIYEHNGKMAELFGTVVGAQYTIIPGSKNMLGGRHNCNAALQLFVEKDSPLNTAQTTVPVNQ